MEKNYNLKKAIRYNILLCSALLLSICNVNSQNLNFTIDTAIDNGISITETINSGGDAYVLTVFHSGNEELDNIGGGDLIFFLSAINPLTPYMLSVTKNGDPVNFKLNSIDYDTLGLGTISVTNQDDEFISDPTSYPIGNGVLLISNATNALNISEIKIIPAGVLDLNNFGFHNIDIDIVIPLDIEEQSFGQNISVYPNPSNGEITIKNSGIALDKVAISDINGRAVANFNLNGIISNKELDLELTSGLYFMSITSKNTTIVRKIIIK